MIAIHGHRGSRGTHPENTIPSFAEAAAAGAQFVELDVHLSRDGHLVVFHDLEISARLCPGLAAPIALAELTLEDIRSYDVGGQRLDAFPEQRLFPGARIPTLEELILWKKKNAPALRLNVEIKSGSAPADRLAHATVALLEKHGLLEESLVQSFDLDIVRAVRALSEKLKLSCLFEEPAEFARLAYECRAEVVAAHYLLTDERLARECRSAGLELLPWTVNDATEWRRLIDLGVGAIITDYPRRLIEFLATE